jgi:hypothetical protein
MRLMSIKAECTQVGVEHAGLRSVRACKSRRHAWAVGVEGTTVLG